MRPPQQANTRASFHPTAEPLGAAGQSPTAAPTHGFPWLPGCIARPAPSPSPGLVSSLLTGPPTSTMPFLFPPNHSSPSHPFKKQAKSRPRVRSSSMDVPPHPKPGPEATQWPARPPGPGSLTLLPAHGPSRSSLTPLPAPAVPWPLPAPAVPWPPRAPHSEFWHLLPPLL